MRGIPQVFFISRRFHAIQAACELPSNRHRREADSAIQLFGGLHVRVKIREHATSSQIDKRRYSIFIPPN